MWEACVVEHLWNDGDPLPEPRLWWISFDEATSVACEYAVVDNSIILLNSRGRDATYLVCHRSTQYATEVLFLEHIGLGRNVIARRAATVYYNLTFEDSDDE